MNALLASMILAPSQLKLDDMERVISSGRFPKISSVIVEKKGRIVYEKYFGQGDKSMLNDTRSVTKTVTALAAGIAGEKLGIDIAKVLVRETLGATPADAAWNGATLHDLLTMSSPLAADDSDGESPGNEDRMHEQERWLQWALALPAKQAAAKEYPFCYATVNAVLAGQVVEALAGTRLDTFLERELFGPLGIEKSQFQYSKSGEVMSGGGLRLTALDLTKLGRVILDHGKYRGKHVIPAEWVAAMTTAHRTDTVMKGVDYGYFLWRISFGEDDSAWCMLGNGGNIVAAFPKRDLVVTVTRTDYNSGSTPAETLELLGKLILPNVK